MRQLDLCSGIGAGFPLAGLQLESFNLVALCECDEWCQSILKLRFPAIPIYDDVRGLTVSDSLRGIQLVTASPPCQPFSVQGLRQGADDKRDCFPAGLKAIATIRPQYFCIENVPGLLSCPYSPRISRPYFDWLLQEISECGYDAEWLVVGSGHFAAPWRRQRLLLVGVSRRLVFFEQPQSWAEQVRGSVEEVRGNSKRGVHRPEVVREKVQSTSQLDKPIGIQTGDGVVRARRAALGNCLDPRVAAVALKRVLYLSSLTQKEA